MTKFIIRRLLQSIPTFFGVTIIAFLIMVAAPGDPVSLLSFNPTTRPEQRAILAAKLGVSDSVPIQYLRWLLGDDWMRWDSDGDDIADGSFLIALDTNGDGINEPPGDRYGILRGDFGRSFTYKQDPLTLIGQFLPATIELQMVVLTVSITIGIPIGVLAAIWRGGFFDNITRILAVIGNAVPDFWLAFLLIIFLAGPGLGLFPSGGRCAPIRGGCPPIYQRLSYLVLPASVLIVGAIAGWSRYMRAAMLETISSDYIRTARAKGLSNTNVWFKHGLRNALIPVATFLGPVLVGLIGSSVIIERIFSWPGYGRLTLTAVTAQDYPIVMASVVIGALLTILAYLISDVLYAVFDPRIRF